MKRAMLLGLFFTLAAHPSAFGASGRTTDRSYASYQAAARATGAFYMSRSAKTRNAFGVVRARDLEVSATSAALNRGQKTKRLTVWTKRVLAKNPLQHSAWMTVTVKQLKSGKWKGFTDAARPVQIAAQDAHRPAPVIAR